MKGNAVTAARYLLRGASLLTHRRLRPFVLVPLVINILIFSTLIVFTIQYLAGWMETLLGTIPGWLSFIQWLLWPLVAIVLALLTGYLFTAVALLIASPFNALLAEKTEELVTGREVQGLEGLRAALMEVPRAILRELVKLLYYLPLLLITLLLTLIPGINAFSPLLWFLFGAWMMCLQFLDYPMDNHRFSFPQVRRAARSRRLSSLGFGGLVALASGIPLVNFIVVPAAVVGATIYWCEELAGKDPF